jgi:Delta24(24(1))-sterol reductase
VLTDNSELTNGTVSNGHLSNGKPNNPPNAPRIIDGWKEGTDPRIDYSGRFEFGGTLGVSAMMIGFPLLMYYMWIGATYYDGRFPRPVRGESLPDFLQRMGQLVYEGAFPTAKAWAMYWTFFVFEAACYLLLPGITVQGRPLPHAHNQQLPYYCSAVWSFYVTLLVAGLLHTTAVFKLDTLIDDFGPLMSVAILSGFLVSVLAYASAHFRGATHRMTGRRIYDFFMGAELNPRLFGRLDFKMFFEVRLPWYILLLMTLGVAARQHERYGYVSGEVAFLCLAHFLYANACSKAEECIVPTWDMYYEKWGFMLIFWNLAGVPLSYCHCSIYLANHDPAVYRWNRGALAALFVVYLFVYWVWDTANSQKNRFKAQLNGNDVDRGSFPQLPWRTVKNPKTITSESGDVIFVDGWCMSHLSIPPFPLHSPTKPKRND